MAKQAKKPRKESRSQEEVKVVAEIERITKAGGTAQSLKPFKIALAKLKFARLAPKRVNKALKAIHQVGQLSTSSYSFDDSQVEKIGEALKNAVNAACGKFLPQTAQEKDAGFTL